VAWKRKILKKIEKYLGLRNNDRNMWFWNENGGKFFGKLEMVKIIDLI
jgi:hypothetical protein